MLGGILALLIKFAFCCLFDLPASVSCVGFGWIKTKLLQLAALNSKSSQDWKNPIASLNHICTALVWRCNSVWRFHCWIFVVRASRCLLGSPKFIIHFLAFQPGMHSTDILRGRYSNLKRNILTQLPTWEHSPKLTGCCSVLCTFLSLVYLFFYLLIFFLRSPLPTALLQAFFLCSLNHYQLAMFKVINLLCGRINKRVQYCTFKLRPTVLKISKWRSDKLNHKVLSRGRNCDVRFLCTGWICGGNTTSLSLCCTNKLFSI